MQILISKFFFLNVKILNLSQHRRAPWETSVFFRHIHGVSLYRQFVWHSLALISLTGHSPVHTSTNGTTCRLGWCHRNITITFSCFFHFLFCLWIHFDPAAQMFSLCCLNYNFQTVDKTSKYTIYILHKNTCCRLSLEAMNCFRMEVMLSESHMELWVVLDESQVMSIAEVRSQVKQVWSINMIKKKGQVRI